MTDPLGHVVMDVDADLELNQPSPSQSGMVSIEMHAPLSTGVECC